MASPTYTILGTDTVRDALKVKAKGNFDELWDKLDPDLAIGAYTSLPQRLTAMDAAISAAGGGVAYMVVNTDAARVAYTTLTPGMLFSVTDTYRPWFYYNSAWTSVPMYGLAGTWTALQTFSCISFSTISGPIAFTSTITASGTVKLTGATSIQAALTIESSCAFSTIPTGPASDPTTVNQLSRKNYVDIRSMFMGL